MILRPQRMSFVAFCLLCSLVQQNTCGQSPLPRPFEHSFEELSSAFSKLESAPDGSSHQILLDETSVRFNERKACVLTTRRVWKILQRDIGELGILEKEYSPWYQNQPTIRGRVFDDQGKVYELSSDDVTVSPAQSSDRTILSDNLIVRAALPGLRMGAIVEEMIILEDREPFFAPGTMKRFIMDRFVPTAFLSLEIESPDNVPLVYAYSDSELESASETEKSGAGRSVRRFEVNKPRFLNSTDMESYLPREKENFHHVTLGTGRSWKDIAEGYTKIVEGRLKDADLDALVREVTAGKDGSHREKILACVRWVKQNVRYTGITLGDASIVPARPLQVASRRFGDCKDQATLLVGMLRKLDIEANVALVSATTWRLPVVSIPCLNAFDHAIVCIREQGQEYWIDTTHPGSTLDNVPQHLQGKHALIAATTTEQLSLIPIGTNTIIEDRTMIASADGLMSLGNNETSQGYVAANSRENAILEPKEEFEKRALAQLVESVPNATFELTHATDPWDDVAEFKRSTLSKNVPLLKVSEGLYRYDATVRRIVQDIPYCQLIDVSKKENDRKNEAEVLIPYSWNRFTTFVPAAGYKIVGKSEKASETIGPIHFSRITQLQPDGSCRVEVRVDVQAGTISLNDLGKLAQLAVDVDEPTHFLNATFFMQSDKSTPVDSNIWAEKIATLKRSWEQDKSGDVLYSLVIELMKVAQGEEARRITEQAVRDFPRDTEVCTARAVALTHDLAGRELFPGMDRDGAEAMFREAIKLSPKNWRAYYLLINLMELDKNGVNEGTDQTAAEILELISQAEKEGSQNERLLTQKIDVLARLNRFSEAIQTASKNRLSDLEAAVRCLQFAIESRWGELESYRDRIARNEPLRKYILGYVEQAILARRQYKQVSEFTEKFLGTITPQIEKILQEQQKLKLVEVPSPPTGSPEKTMQTLLLRLATEGIQPNEWHDLILNPESEDANLESLNMLLTNMRNNVHRLRINKNRVMDLLGDFTFRMEGNDEQGFLCHVKFKAFDLAFCVLRERDSYKILLAGNSNGQRAKRAEELLKQGKTNEATKWMEWAAFGLNSGTPLAAESGNPAISLWNSTRKKTPELVALVAKMLLHLEGFDDANYRFLKDAIRAEKSNFRKTQIGRCLVLGLLISKSPLYESEAISFVKENPGLPMEKCRLISFYALQGDHARAQEMLDETRDSIPDNELERLNDLISWNRNEMHSILESRIAMARKAPTSFTWNSVLWASIFSDSITIDVVKDAADIIRQDGTPVAVHSLGYAEADVGMIEDSVSELHYIIRARGDRIKDVDWLIVGRLAEKCGLNDAARRAYERIKPNSEITSTHSLSQRRLKLLEQTKP